MTTDSETGHATIDDTLAAKREMSWLQEVTRTQPFWVLIAILVIGLVMSWVSDVFMTERNMFNVARNAWLQAMTPIEPVRFIAHAPPTALLLQNGRSDNLVPEADAQALHRAVPEPRTILWYAAGHGLDQQAFFDRLDWLHEQIGLDARQ